MGPGAKSCSLLLSCPSSPLFSEMAWLEPVGDWWISEKLFAAVMGKEVIPVAWVLQFTGRDKVKCVDYVNGGRDLTIDSQGQQPVCVFKGWTKAAARWHDSGYLTSGLCEYR